jgi:hypothetical protein
MEPQGNDVDPGPDAMKVGVGNACGGSTMG